MIDNGQCHCLGNRGAAYPRLGGVPLRLSRLRACLLLAACHRKQLQLPTSLMKRFLSFSCSVCQARFMGTIKATRDKPGRSSPMDAEKILIGRLLADRNQPNRTSEVTTDFRNLDIRNTRCLVQTHTSEIMALRTTTWDTQAQSERTSRGGTLSLPRLWRPVRIQAQTACCQAQMGAHRGPTAGSEGFDAQQQKSAFKHLPAGGT